MIDTRNSEYLPNIWSPETSSDFHDLKKEITQKALINDRVIEMIRVWKYEIIFDDQDKANVTMHFKEKSTIQILKLLNNIIEKQKFILECDIKDAKYLIIHLKKWDYWIINITWAILTDKIKKQTD